MDKATRRSNFTIHDGKLMRELPLECVAVTSLSTRVGVARGRKGMTKNSFGARTALDAGGKTYTIYALEALAKRGFKLDRLPFSIKVMLENVLRREDGVNVTADQVEAVARWQPQPGEREFSFMPARVLLQDFTGVPVVADLAVMRDAITQARRRPRPDQSAAARRSRDRSFGAGRFFRAGVVVRAQRGARVRAQPGALPVPALGPGRVR